MHQPIQPKGLIKCTKNIVELARGVSKLLWLHFIFIQYEN